MEEGWEEWGGVRACLVCAVVNCCCVRNAPSLFARICPFQVLPPIPPLLLVLGHRLLQRSQRHVGAPAGPGAAAITAAGGGDLKR